MKKIKGPAIFLAQFASDEAPFNDWRSICRWAASLGYKGVQVPTFVESFIDLEKAATSKDYCDELKGVAEEEGVVITELSTHLQGQLVAVHPAYDLLFDNFAPKELHGKPKERTEWAVQQLKWGAAASRNLGLDVHGTFSGALIWQTVYPWPQRPQGLVDTAFAELARRGETMLDVIVEHGVAVCSELL